MKIEGVVVGSEIKENCYLIIDEVTNSCLVVDPGDEVDDILDIIKERQVLGILITHYHFDHIGALDDLVEKYNCPVYDINNKNQKIVTSNFTFNVIPTPGHKEDSVTFYFENEKIMFTGDFLFYHTIGRCDLEGSNYQEMLQSIELIKKYDRSITVYPGHGKSTTLGEEFDNNEYFLNL